MEFLSNKPLLITDTILRDAHQSQAATRMTTEDMLPALEMLDSIGYYSLECWGGATFDACMRFLNEDPWERLRTIRQHVKHTKLQMLFRGQNILGYKHYADDVVDAFCRKSIENGIDIIRIFDALNDVRNLEQAIKSTRKYGGEVEATMSYTVSPIHNEDYFVKLAKTLENMGASAICVKDMANLLLPMDAYSLIKRLKETVSIPIHLHTHNTTGTGDMVNLMAAMAGVDIVDTALSPLANGTSQPATESLVATLRGTVRDTGLDQSKLSEAAAHFRKVAARLQNEGILDPKVLRVDTNTLRDHLHNIFLVGHIQHGGHSVCGRQSGFDRIADADILSAVIRFQFNSNGDLALGRCRGVGIHNVRNRLGHLEICDLQKTATGHLQNGFLRVFIHGGSPPFFRNKGSSPLPDAPRLTCSGRPGKKRELWAPGTPGRRLEGLNGHLPGLERSILQSSVARLSLSNSGPKIMH